MRRITPEEYDDAALRRPASVPLRAMGDLRTGRQLLADADADRAAPFADTHGECRRLLRYLQEACARLDRELSAPLRETVAAGGTAHFPVSHAGPQPLPSDPCIWPARWAVPARWVPAAAMPYWGLGLRPDAVAGALEALPAEQQELFCRALWLGGPPWRPHGPAMRGTDPGGVAELQGACGALREPGELWEAEAEAGFLSAAYDAATGRRLGLSMNRRQAREIRIWLCSVGGGGVYATVRGQDSLYFALEPLLPTILHPNQLHPAELLRGRSYKCQIMFDHRPAPISCRDLDRSPLTPFPPPAIHPK